MIAVMRDRPRAARLAAARRGALGMSQQQLADEAGIDIKTIGNFESRGRWPIARTRARIEAALGWEPGELDRLADEHAEASATLTAEDDWERRVLSDPTLPPDEQRNIVLRTRRLKAELYPSGRAAARPPEDRDSLDSRDAAAG